ncbi:hypothetical protein AB1N83_010039 [Pleurotus pulmonarius]
MFSKRRHASNLGPTLRFPTAGLTLYVLHVVFFVAGSSSQTSLKKLAYVQRAQSPEQSAANLSHKLTIPA